VRLNTNKKRRKAKIIYECCAVGA